MSNIKYIDVTVENNSGQTATMRFPDNERGQSLVKTLQGKARREELASVKLGSKAAKGPEYPDDVAPERRRGRPVEGQVEATAPVETTDNPDEVTAEAHAEGEAKAQAKAAKAEAKSSK